MGYRSRGAPLCLVTLLVLVAAGRPSQADDPIDLTDPNWTDPWEDSAEGPYVSVETFPLPTVRGIDAELLMELSRQIGVDGTSVAGIRLKIGLPRGYILEDLAVEAADAMFLVKDRPFLNRVGDFFSRIARFLLFGRLVSAGSTLEIPSEAWYVLFEVAPLVGDAVTLHPKDEVRFKNGDSNLSDHGSFFVCRFMLASNSLSELVNVRITGKHPRTKDVVRYHVPRLKLPPVPAPSEPGKSRPSLAVRMPLVSSPH